MNDWIRALAPLTWTTAAAIGLLAALAAVIDGATHGQFPHAVLVFGVTALAGVGALFIARRRMVALAAAAAVAVWPLPHLVPWTFLMAAIVVGAALFLRLPSKMLEAGAAAGASGVLALLVLKMPLAAAVAAILAGSLTFVRPEAPTQGMLRFLRTGALFLPMAGMVLGLIVNAATQRAEHLPAQEAVYLGAALAGLLVLACLALLGLGTLLESREPRQQGAWLSAAVGAGLLCGSFASLNPDDVIATFSVLAAPLAALAALASARLANAWPRLRHPLPFLATLATATQWGMQV